MSAHTRPLLHNKNSFQYTVICLKPLLPLFFPLKKFWQLQKCMECFTYHCTKDINEKQVWCMVYALPAPFWTQPHSKHNQKEGSKGWYEMILLGQFSSFMICSLSLFFRADILLPLNQLPFLVKREVVHYFSSLRCHFIILIFPLFSTIFLLFGWMEALFSHRLILSCNYEIQLISISSHSGIFFLTNGKVRKCKLF